MMILKDVIKPSGTDLLIPYVISPRNTFVDTRQPRLRWNKVQGAISYQVKIAAYSKIIWSKTVNETEFNSREPLPLEVGVDYSLIVESDNGRSSEMDSNQSLLLFRLLDEETKLAVSQELSQANNLELPEDKKIRAIIDIYTTYGLNTKAIEILELEMVKASLKSPILHQELGNLYQCVGFYHLAEEQYRQALALLTDEQVQAKISALTELKEILSLMGRDNEAKIMKAARDTFKLRNLARVDCSADCEGKCGECFKDGNPGKYVGIGANRRCTTAGC